MVWTLSPQGSRTEQMHKSKFMSPECHSCKIDAEHNDLFDGEQRWDYENVFTMHPKKFAHTMSTQLQELMYDIKESKNINKRMLTKENRLVYIGLIIVVFATLLWLFGF